MAPDMTVGDTFLKNWNNQMVAHSPQSVLPISNNGGP